MAPKAESEDIHDSSSVVIFPESKGDASDLNNSRFGPGKPMTMPKMNAVKFTAMQNHFLVKLAGTFLVLLVLKDF